MRILVTGGAGFIGSHTTAMLLAQGFDVRVFDNLSTGSLANLPERASGLAFIQGDICDERALREAMRGCDAVLHLAAVVSVPESIARPTWVHAINAGGTLNVLEAARALGIRRVVLASSAAVYGPGASPAAEEATPLPLSPYAAQKLMGETYAALYSDLHGLSAISLRYFNVFGPRQCPGSPYSGVLSRFIGAVLDGRPVTILGDGLQTRDFVNVQDVARANVLALQAPHDVVRRVFNVGTGRSISVNEAYEAITRLVPEAAGRPALYGEARSGDVRHSLARCDWAWEHLGFRAMADWGQSLAETIAWASGSPAEARIAVAIQGPAA